MKAGNKTVGARLRLVIAPDIAIGPGKAALLEGIKETGSISAACRRMGMSYKRAWYLVETLNSHFDKPLIETVKGGRAGGGARLTALGEDVLQSFRGIESTLDDAVGPTIKRLRRRIPSI